MIRVLYHREPEGWWAESPDIDGWSVAGKSYEDIRRLAEDGVSFAMASAAEDSGQGFDENQGASVDIEHYPPESAGGAHRDGSSVTPDAGVSLRRPSETSHRAGR